MTLYLDIIFLENMCMNYIILFTTALIKKNKIKQFRLFLSSAIGSFYAIITYLTVANFFLNIFMKIILSVSMVWIAYESKNFKALIKDIVAFYLISFVFGGCAFALIYFINPKKVIINNGVLVGIYPIKVTLIAGIIAFIITQIVFKITKDKISIKDMLCNVFIYYGNQKIKVKAFIDSGNMLMDPLSRRSGCNY